MGDITEYYHGKKVLVTGATGFCGKVLVEKLLRSCESITSIYVLMRSKKNVSPNERFLNFINDLIFDEIRHKNEKVLEKIILISGDINLDGLKLSLQDENALVENVNIVFHIAANVNFNDPLKEAINNNVTGTLRVLKLAERMKNIEVFSYMSTAFCQSYQEELEERFYPTNLNIPDIIKKTQQMDKGQLDALEAELRGKTKHPNTYTLSKAMAEEMVYSYREKIPIAVIRPCLIWYALNEPFQGYVDGLNSGIAIVCGGMTGFIRTMYVGHKAVAKITPIDYVINATIASAWKCATTPKEDPRILFYNCTDAEENPYLWESGAVYGKKTFYEYAPLEKLIWYPKISYTSSYLWHMISLLLFQVIPAMILDFLKLMSGKKPLFTRLQFKIIESMGIYYYFTTRHFQFETKKLRELFNELGEDDKMKFGFDHTTIDWPRYHHNGVLQLRRLVLKEKDSTIPQAQKKVMKFYYADLAIKAFFLSILFYYLYKLFNLVI